MNAEEALKLCRLSKAFFPAMAMDEYTPAAWALAFERERYADAEVALTELAREVTFIDIAAVVARIKRIRRDRVLDFGTPPEPPREVDPDDTLAYRRWLRETQQRIADGEPVEVTPIHRVPMPKELAAGIASFGRMPDDAETEEPA